MKNIYEELQFEITHKCNKNCDGCNHRISTSNMPDMDTNDLIYVLLCLSRKDIEEIKSIELIGGEPLMHQRLNDIVGLLNDFFDSSVRIRVITNGKLLPKVKKEVFDRCEWWVSRYIGWNDEIFEQYANTPNVKLGSHKDFQDCEASPNLPESSAKIAYSRCVHRQIRIFGRHVYGCCMAESNERAHGLSVGSEFAQDWRSIVEALPTWRACSVCYLAPNAL